MAAGSAYLFDAATGQELQRFTATDGRAGDDFGRSVALFGNLALVGAPEASLSGVRYGAAYLFDATTGAQLRRLEGDDTSFFDRFGASVALNGTSLVVGSGLVDSVSLNDGAAYVFDAATGRRPAS